MTLLADTHILLYWLDDPRSLSATQRRALQQAGPEAPVLVSDISLWEITMLQSLGRITLDRPLREWLELAVSPPLVRRASITPAVAATVVSLPETFHRDPADRIIVATAIVWGAALLTNDKRIRDSRLVPVL